jgi:hypothetical protein
VGGDNMSHKEIDLGSVFIFPENMSAGNYLKLDFTLQFERYNTSADVLHEH